MSREYEDKAVLGSKRQQADWQRLDGLIFPDRHITFESGNKTSDLKEETVVAKGSVSAAPEVVAQPRKKRRKRWDPEVPNPTPGTTNLNEGDEEMSLDDEHYERKITKLLNEVENGTASQSETALRWLTDKAPEFGAGPLFDCMLPLLMGNQEKHKERNLLVKVIVGVLSKLDSNLVRPYVYEILVLSYRLLNDEDYFARVDGREIISCLSKTAGLETMIDEMGPDIEHINEYVRNATASAFSVVASTLGIHALLPFLRKASWNEDSWQARHTGIKIVQQIAILMGSTVLPQLTSLVETIGHGLNDENKKVRTITALSLAALAEAAAPYGMESFDSVLKPLFCSIRAGRGKVTAAFLKAIGFIIPLMDPVYADYYTREVMFVLFNYSSTKPTDEDFNEVVLKVVKQCVSKEGVQADNIRRDVLPVFFRKFWASRMVLDRRNSRQLIETTVEMAKKVGVADIVGRIGEDLKDESEPYRRMVRETIKKGVSKSGCL